MTCPSQFLAFEVGAFAALVVFAFCVGVHAALRAWERRRAQPEDEDAMDLLSYADAQEAKEAALERIASHNIGWSKRAAAAIMALPDGFVGIGENFTKAVLDAGVGEPPKNAMGPVILALVKRGVLVETGVWLAMQKKGSNARRSPQYIKRTPEVLA